MDQGLDFRRHRRSTMTNPAFPFPIQPKTLAVPSDDGLGFHNAQGGAPVGPNSGEPDPNESVARSQLQAAVLVHALQQKKLMTGVPGSPLAERPEFEGSREARRAEKRGVRTSIAPYHALPQVQPFNEHGFLGRDNRRKDGRVSLRLKSHLLVESNVGFRLSAYLRSISCRLQFASGREVGL